MIVNGRQHGWKKRHQLRITMVGQIGRSRVMRMTTTVSLTMTSHKKRTQHGLLLIGMEDGCLEKSQALSYLIMAWLNLNTHALHQIKAEIVVSNWLMGKSQGMTMESGREQ